LTNDNPPVRKINESIIVDKACEHDEHRNKKGS